MLFCLILLHYVNGINKVMMMMTPKHTLLKTILSLLRYRCSNNARPATLDTNLTDTSSSVTVELCRL